MEDYFLSQSADSTRPPLSIQHRPTMLASWAPIQRNSPPRDGPSQCGKKRAKRLGSTPPPHLTSQWCNSAPNMTHHRRPLNNPLRGNEIESIIPVCVPSIELWKRDLDSHFFSQIGYGKRTNCTATYRKCRHAQYFGCQRQFAS